jgi:hypothetical protein
MTPQDIQDKAWQDLGPVTGDFGKKYEAMKNRRAIDKLADGALVVGVIALIFAVVWAWIKVFAI